MTILETIPPQSTIHKNTHSPSSNTFQYRCHSKGNRLMVLHSILDSVTAVEQEWPGSAMSAVQKRFERMPRNGWSSILRHYTGKFCRTVDIVNGERCRIATCLTEPCPLTDTTMVVRTRKLPILKLINRITGEYAEFHVPKNVSDAARIIQAAQKPRSAWKENIESKISKPVLSKDLLEKACKKEKLSTSKTKSLGKIRREFNLDLSKINDLSEALVKKNEALNVYEKKITMYESRRKFRKENRMFELFRGRFYRGLSGRFESEHVVYRDEISEFWSTMWNKNDKVVTYDEYLIPFVSDTQQTTFPSLEDFLDIINWLPNWKAAGIDGIYNFYIKKLTSLHKYLYDIVKAICLEGTPQADWYYCGLTYLIPKGTLRRGSDYRSIACMSNLYKLTTKCVTKVVQLEVERRGLLAENQLGAVRGVQGAKEQAPMNIALNKEYENNLKATCIDVKTAYNSLDHAYLTQCIKNLNLSNWILKFIKVTISKWKIDISVGYGKIMSKKIDRGILQGDSLSHLLFVLCMNPLSRKLNEKYTKVSIKTDAESYETNHLLFIDDLKLLAEDGQILEEYTEEVKKFMNKIVLEINKEKPATNKSFEEVQLKLIARVERLCRTRLNSRNIFQAMHQLAISLLNYHISNKIHLRPGCKERLYLPRKELGRDLHSVERAAILNVENNNKTHLSLIKNFLKIKYGLEEEKGSLKPLDGAVVCYIQHRNVFRGAKGMVQHCNRSRKTVDHLATRCKKMLGYDYTRLHNEVVRCIHLLLLNKYKFKSSKRIRSHSVQEIFDNEYAEIRTRYFILEKRQNRITLIEVGITSQDSLQIVETEKLRKYDLLANELGLIYKCSVEIIPYVMTWDGIVTKYHNTYVKRLQIPMNVEAYIQSIVLKKTVETISFDRRRGLNASLSVILGAEIDKQPTPLLKQVDNEEDEPKTNTNKELELEEEKEVVEMVEIII
ncbi:reverse transcriptase [Hamiltosporidium tvaerminnensis]|uniref:Reverse transcriptase n=1 Tax=Hamiltosporidium tvaerminnensis TaxID=1176355 RepID=A0A4Q9LUH7_9MICR|nr:reverse transcriptase [Hamiltosporidium tvaerminnensis]